MREKNRKPIASIKKLPQFTTMNVIDGQAGLVNYSSLIFYSLTIDNILNIIVLLILAGVSIATLTGNNGILTRAQEAKNKTEQAQKDEENILSSYEDKINEYAGIDWNEAMSNAKAPEDQTTTSKNVIGLGTNGRAVNMDLWEYTLLEDGTYSLLSADSLDAIENKLWDNVVSGYKGSYDEEGKISGTIPNYISTDNGNNYIPVTSLSNLFRNCTELKIAPQLPSTVTDISNTFNNTSIVEAPEIPNGVIDMNSTFQNCTKLTTPPKIPNSVTNMQGTFNECSSLEIAPAIPNGVINMYGTFQNTSIIEAPEIPNSVTNMKMTFRNCASLRTVLDLSDNLENMNATFQDCTSLIVAPDIPNGVQNMFRTFDGCTNLETPPTLIPSSVTDMRRTFKNCYKLSGTIKIEANITGKIIDDEIDCRYCFSLDEPTKNETNITLTGDNTVLNLIINNSPNNTIHID